MYTPGSTSPQLSRPARKSTRFSRGPSGSKAQPNVSQSYLLPSNMPNTSQILPDHGALPNIQVHYNIPADEKQIVASLRSLQRDLAEAMQTINDLTRERDEAIHELRLMKATSRKPSSPNKRQTRNIEQELFDLSSPIQEPPQRSATRDSEQRKDAIADKQVTASDDARVLSNIPLNEVGGRRSGKRMLSNDVKGQGKQYQKPMVEDTDQSALAEENPTAASNTSRRRRQPSMDENMTSAYILPDITVEQGKEYAKVSRAAQQVLHSFDPEHVANCNVCHRLTSKSKPVAKYADKPVVAGTKVTDFANKVTSTMQQPDYTAALAGFADESVLADPTMRPKISPTSALARVRILMDAQFKRAKDRHRLAWEKYDRIEAPLSSKKHAEVSKEMQHWAEKMEECRIHLDYLRDVEEGMRNDV